MTHSEPQVQFISADRLIVDIHVQRVTDRRRVEKMAADYNPDALGVLVVSNRGDGTYHIIDGAHRRDTVVAAGFPDAKLQCLVYSDLTAAEEAAMFVKLNTTRAVQAIDKFRVRVVEGDPAAVRINQVLERHGWTVQMGKGFGSFAAVISIEKVYSTVAADREDNIGIIETLVSVLTAAWGHDPDGMRREILNGVGGVLLRHGVVDLAKLTNELSQFQGGPTALIGKARGLRDLRGGLIGDSMAEIVVNLLNKGRRVNKLPDWRDAA